MSILENRLARLESKSDVSEFSHLSNEEFAKQAWLALADPAAYTRQYPPRAGRRKPTPYDGLSREDLTKRLEAGLEAMGYGRPNQAALH